MASGYASSNRARASRSFCTMAWAAPFSPGSIQESFTSLPSITVSSRSMPAVTGRATSLTTLSRTGREMALDVVRLLDHLSIRRAHIVGYSMGAGITSQLLTLHPDRFLTATLGAAAGRFAWTPDDERLAKQEADEREKECVSRTLMYRLAPTNEPKPGEAEIQKRSKACFADATQDRFAIAALTRARGQTVIEPTRAAAVTVPTLGIVGDLDTNLTGLQELKKIRPSLQLVIIEGAVHSSADPRGAMRSPQFITSLRAFIASHREGSTR